MNRAFLITLLAVAVTGCATAKLPTKPITLPDGNQGLVTNCDGKKINWDYCYNTASKACPGGYEISYKDEVISEVGISRNLYFMCN
jgi:hypothetical protein